MTTHQADLAKLLDRAIRQGFVPPPPAGGFHPREGKALPWKFLPDTRGSFGDVALRRILLEAAQLVIPADGIDALAGVANSGISWASALGIVTGLPSVTVLLEPRSSGRQRQVEGSILNRRVVLVDNVVRSGASIRVAAQVVNAAGGHVVGAFAVVALDAPPDLDFPLFTCWSVDQINQACTANSEVTDVENLQR